MKNKNNLKIYVVCDGCKNQIVDEDNVTYCNKCWTNIILLKQQKYKALQQKYEDLKSKIRELHERK